MKLINILIEKDIQWPNGATGVVQDVDGEIKFYAGEKPVLDGLVWIRDVAISKVRNNKTASDYKTAIITKQEWDRKMNKAMFVDVKVGDKVWDIRMGWRVVDEVNHCSDYPIHVGFAQGKGETYTLDGYFDEDDINPSLFWDEIEIKAPPKPLPKLEVDTKVIVWDNRKSELKRHFSHFDKDGVLHAFHDGRTSFSSASSTKPWDNWKLAE